MLNHRVIYHEPQATFFQDVEENKFRDKMLARAGSVGIVPGKAEAKSWKNNGPAIASLLKKSNVSDTFVTFEYMVPYNLQRIDCMIYGKDKNGKGNVVHIELKQWDNNGVKQANADGNFQEVEAFTGGANRYVAHPSQQVRGYNDYLTGFVDVIANDQLGIDGMAYCYNYYRYKDPHELFDPKYNNLIAEYRTYGADEVDLLAERLHNELCNGDGFSCFNKMMNSSIRPSKKLLDEASQMLDGADPNVFNLIDDQIVAKNVIIDKIRKLSRAKKKAVVIVKGGPGTGKTVIALHVLAYLAMSKKQLNIHYATKSTALLNGIADKLNKRGSAHLLFSNVNKCIPSLMDENELDVLLVDEAHRIGKSPNHRFTKAADRTDLSQIDTLLRCSKVLVLFVDDKQVIRASEVGSVEYLKEAALAYGATVDEVTLTSQFRCNGSDNYLDWLDQILYNKPVTANFAQDDYEFKIFDDAYEMYQEIRRKDGTVQGDTKMTARLTAGYCWPYSKTVGPDGQLIKDVKVGRLEIPWEPNEKLTRRPKGCCKWYEWAYAPDGINECGSIYTAQGFEFDYVGVIVGKDLYYSKQRDCLLVDVSQSADPTLKYRNGEVSAEEYVRNIYRVLMSRGMKGCYVYFCDPGVKEYFKKHMPKQETIDVEVTANKSEMAKV